MPQAPIPIRWESQAPPISPQIIPKWLLALYIFYAGLFITQLGVTYGLLSIGPMNFILKLILQITYFSIMFFSLISEQPQRINECLNWHNNRSAATYLPKAITTLIVLRTAFWITCALLVPLIYRFVDAKYLDPKGPLHLIQLTMCLDVLIAITSLLLLITAFAKTCQNFHDRDRPSNQNIFFWIFEPWIFLTFFFVPAHALIIPSPITAFYFIAPTICFLALFCAYEFTLSHLNHPEMQRDRPEPIVAPVSQVRVVPQNENPAEAPHLSHHREHSPFAANMRT